MNTALLIIDIQNDYFPEGKNPLVGSLEASLKAKTLLEHFRQANLPIVHVRHVSVRKGASFFLPGSPGAEIHDNVRPKIGERTIHKNFPNAFRNTDLQKLLRQNNYERLVICGMQTHMCVDASVRAASDFGFECLVAHDACATKDLSFEDALIPAQQVHLAFLAALNAAYASVLSVDEVIVQLRSN